MTATATLSPPRPKLTQLLFTFDTRDNARPVSYDIGWQVGANFVNGRYDERKLASITDAPPDFYRGFFDGIYDGSFGYVTCDEHGRMIHSCQGCA